MLEAFLVASYTTDAAGGITCSDQASAALIGVPSPQQRMVGDLPVVPPGWTTPPHAGCPFGCALEGGAAGKGSWVHR
jgi:hypothetical protein